MKRVGLLISTLNSGGAERVVSRLSKILSEKYEIYLILFEDTYMEYDYNGKLINLDIKASNSILKQLLLPFHRANKLRKVKKENNIDVVISFLDGPNIVNVLSRTKNCKTILSIRNYTIKEEKQNIRTKILSCITGKLYKKSDKIISVSECIRKSIINKYDIDERKIATIYNPYNDKEIEELSNEEIDEKYKEFFNSNKTFISVGRMMYQKGFWHLIKAFSLVHQKDNDAKLVIIGKDYQDGKINKLIKEMELEKSILLMGHQSNPFKYLRKSYAYVMTSLFEGFPNALVEAMNCELPIISTDCKSGPREILDGIENINKIINDIEYSKYGILVPELSDIENWNKDEIDGGEKILSKAMFDILINKKLYANYKEKSINRGKNFSYENCKLKYYNILREIIGE